MVYIYNTYVFSYIYFLYKHTNALYMHVSISNSKEKKQ